MRASYFEKTMRQIDQDAATHLGISLFELMQRAGRAVANHALQVFPKLDRWIVLCGPGNNGGDGYVAARSLLAAKRCAAVIEVLPARSADCVRAKAEFIAAGGEVLLPAQCSDTLWQSADGVLDALFGIGARVIAQASDPHLSSWIARINDSQKTILSVDVPSGLNADNGAGECIVRADRTLSLLALKPGLFTGKARAVCGEVHLEDLGYQAPNPADVLLQDSIAFLPRRRDPLAHKGHFGHVCLWGGRLGMQGAIALAAKAALRSGAGLVSVLTDQLTRLALLDWPEIMQQTIDLDAIALSAKCNVLAIGPGLGMDAQAGHSLNAAVTLAVVNKLAMVLDADALNGLAKQSITLPSKVILTPHPLEAARLLGCTVAEIENARIANALALAKKFNATVVLKGAGTIIAAADQTPVICMRGNPGMASGGMGDVLTGVIAGLLAQGLSPWQSACDGVAIHALAADIAAKQGEAGMLASDVIAALRGVLNRNVNF